MTTDIIRHGMTGMRQKWDEWHRNDGMRPSLRQPNFHLIQLILMSFVSFRHHPKAVYNGDDSLMTPKWGPRQDRSWQLSLSRTVKSKACSNFFCEERNRLEHYISNDDNRRLTSWLGAQQTWAWHQLGGSGDQRRLQLSHPGCLSPSTEIPTASKYLFW